PRISGDPVSPLEKIPAAHPGYQTQVQSWISIQTGVPLDDEQAAELQKAVAVALADTRAADDDYDNLKMAATRAAEALRSESPESAQRVILAALFVELMPDDYIVFLSCLVIISAALLDGESLSDAARQTTLRVMRSRPARAHAVTVLGYE